MVARGVYAWAGEWRELRPWERYLARVHATRTSHPRGLSTCSSRAAALRGLPVIGEPADVHVAAAAPYATSRAVAGVRVHTTQTPSRIRGDRRTPRRGARRDRGRHRPQPPPRDRTRRCRQRAAERPELDSCRAARTQPHAPQQPWTSSCPLGAGSCDGGARVHARVPESRRDRMARLSRARTAEVDPRRRARGRLPLGLSGGKPPGPAARPTEMRNTAGKDAVGSAARPQEHGMPS